MPQDEERSTPRYPFLAPPPAVARRQPRRRQTNKHKDKTGSRATTGFGFSVDDIALPSVIRPQNFDSPQHPTPRPADPGPRAVLAARRTSSPPRRFPTVILKMAQTSQMSTAAMDPTTPTTPTTRPVTRSTTAKAKARDAAQPQPPAGIVPSAESRVVLRASRPKAFDFWDSPITPSATAGAGFDGQGQAQPSTSQMGGTGGAHPPVTPRIPWDLYGIHDQQNVMGSRLAEAGTAKVAVTTSKQATMIENGDEETALTNHFGKQRGALPNPAPPPSAVNAKKRKQQAYEMTDEDDEAGEADHGLDAHDPEMDDDYIPVGPGPMPRAPRLRKGLRKPKKVKRSRPDKGVNTEQDAMEFVVSSGADDTAPDTPVSPRAPLPRAKSVPSRRTGPPPPKRVRSETAPTPNVVPPPRPIPLPRSALTPKTIPPPKPVPAPRVVTTPDQGPGADSAVWNPERLPTPRHQTGGWPPRPGSVYCEPCFRDDCARWIRIRDNVIRVLQILGSDSALGELRHLAYHAERAEAGSAYPDMVRDPDFPRQRLTSPPPPQYQASSSESESEGEGEDGEVRYLAKRLTLAAEPDGGPRFQNSPADVRGLVLLCIIAERHRLGLDQSQQNEVDNLLEALRKDIGLSAKQLHKLGTHCKDLLASYQEPSRIGVGRRGARPDADWWYWEFDEALQAAHEELSAEPEPRWFSSFTRLLARKAEETAIFTLISKAAAGVPDSALEDKSFLTQAQPEFARLRHTLGLGPSSHNLLQTIGDKIARARHHPTHPTPPVTKRRRDEAPTPDNPPPPAKRHRPSPGRALPTPAQSSRAARIPLPCLYCAESDASLARAAREYNTRPWVNPLMWSFSFTVDDALRVAGAEEFVALVARARGAEARMIRMTAGANGLGKRRSKR
ncbi:hypothetical protein BT67DRAFT_435792 [Trichocladium antarcticum]|uniref:Uncharacterized protein n=1 Tax=Trichocladium antarcticum TaxID=1450529 RepID=A0AAN6UFM2_9PEZI|nr:hypothetical protein BT67DRAFT_435792 [Trichocladium antarcticum]